MTSRGSTSGFPFGILACTKTASRVSRRAHPHTLRPVTRSTMSFGDENAKQSDVCQPVCENGVRSASATRTPHRLSAAMIGCVAEQ